MAFASDFVKIWKCRGTEVHSPKLTYNKRNLKTQTITNFIISDFGKNALAQRRDSIFSRKWTYGS